MVERFFLQDGTIFSPWRNDLISGIFSLNYRQAEREMWRMQRESKNRSEQKRLFFLLTYIIHSGFISGYQNRYGDNLKPPTNVYHRMTA